MIARRICAAMLAVGLLGCANRASQSVEPSTASASRGSDVITEEELSQPSVSGGNALEAVRKLRPRFLSVRGSGSIRIASAGSVHVSVDGGPLLDVTYLNRIRPDEIAEIRYLNPSQAAQRFGTSAGSGSVIVVKSK